PQRPARLFTSTTRRKTSKRSSPPSKKPPKSSSCHESNHVVKRALGVSTYEQHRERACGRGAPRSGGRGAWGGAPLKMDDLYKEYILDHYRNPRNFGHLDHADVTAEDLNPLCGDKIRVELKHDDGKIEDVRFSGKGCAISQASMSMLTESLRGQ